MTKSDEYVRHKMCVRPLQRKVAHLKKTLAIICFFISTSLLHWRLPLGVVNMKKLEEMLTLSGKPANIIIKMNVSDRGLCVHPDFPYFGASPDGVVECDCCGRGVIEIKCPFSCRERSFSKASEDSPSFCLGTNEDGQFQLKKKLCLLLPSSAANGTLLSELS